MDDKEKETEGKEQRQETADNAAQMETSEERKELDATAEMTEKKQKTAQSKQETAAKNKESSSSVLGNKTIEDVIQREAREEQDTSSPFSLPKTLGGVLIARAFQKQIWLVCLVCVFFIIYISNRYICQKRMVEIEKVERKLVEVRYKATVCTSILTEKSRESNIMKLLSSYGDSTLTIPNEPPYLIRVEEK